MHAAFFDRFTDLAWDLPLWLALARRQDGPILELGCGTGRVLRHLHNAGLHVEGVDLDAALLERAAASATAVHCADLQTFRSPQLFRTVLLPCNTLSLFQDPEPVLATARAALADGGQLAFDVVVPAGRTWGSPPYRWSRTRNGLAEGGRFDPHTARHDGWMRWDGHEARRTTYYRSATAWHHHLRRAGFHATVQLDAHGQPPSATSDWTLWLAS